MADTPDVQRDSVETVRARPRDAGFGLIEQVIAMTVIIVVLLGLLSTLGATASAVNTARQRTVAVSLVKQRIENLQGADWASVATGTGVTTLDSSHQVTTGTPLKFNNEDLFLGGAGSYRTLSSVTAGTTFALRTFVTTVPSTGTGYRRVTVYIEWPEASPKHTMRFSSLVYPLVYTSYPASSGSAEAAGGLVTLSGCLGGNTFDDVHVALPGARADTNASTQRTAIGVAASASNHAESHVWIEGTPCTPAATTQIDACPRTSVESIADNDSTSTTRANSSSGSANFVECYSPSDAGGVTLKAPSAQAASHAKTDSPCSVACPFADPVPQFSDDVPWADATVTTNSSSWGTSSLWPAQHLWRFGDEWKATASVDHDPGNPRTNGIVTASATLAAPALSILSLPEVHDGVVKVGAFTATVSAESGYTTAPATGPAGTTATMQLWNGVEYVDLLPADIFPTPWAPGTSVDYTSPEQTITSGANQLSYTVKVRSQPPISTTVGALPGLRTDAVAQHPAPLLIVTVVVTLGDPLAGNVFTIEVNYGQVLAHSTWLTEAG